MVPPIPTTKAKTANQSSHPNCRKNAFTADHHLLLKQRAAAFGPIPQPREQTSLHLASVCQVLVEAYSGRESVTIFLQVIAVPRLVHHEMLNSARSNLKTGCFAETLHLPNGNLAKSR